MEVILKRLMHDVGAASRAAQSPARLGGPTEERIAAVGHRVVHGGEEFTGSVLINEAVLASIEKTAHLAPLHNPPNLAGIRAAMHALPGAPQVACFDTAFHATIPQIAFTYALPFELYEELGVRRYGFHGTSHRYVARRAAAMLGREKYDINCITCHLGNGSSITAVRDGRSADTSMGLTPLEGLVMGTRCGDIDPAILFYLVQNGYEFAALNDLCNKKSGVLGVSGLSNDMRTLIEQASAGHQRARLAIDVYCYRVKKYIGAYYAALGRLDAIVFTGGIGENAVPVREKICADMEPLGIKLDRKMNEQARSDERRIDTGDDRVAILVIPTDEEGVIATDTYQLATQ
jgi:acetate kinase